MRQSDVVITPDHSYDIRLVAESHELNKYPAKQHAQRVFQHLATSAGLIYLEGQPTGNWSDSDQPRPFRQRRYFYYLSGVEESDCYLTYDIKIDLLTLYIPDFDLHRAIWMGPTITVEEAQVKYDVDRVRYYACLQSDIDDWIRSHDDTSPIFVLHGSQVPRTSSTTVRFDAERLLPAVDAAREIKDEHEIQMIRHANKISDQAHRQVLENIHRITNETEIEALFLEACVARGAKHQSYEIIAGSGENAAVLHYVKNDEALKDRQLVCLDAGAEWNCYASDVTRTFPLATEDGDWPSREAREIYDLVQNIQTECIRRIKAGTRFLDLQLATHEWVVKGLLKLGILTGGDETELGQSGVSRVFFPHGLGHHIGLEVHDVSAKPITAGQQQQQQQQSSTSNNSSISSSNNQPLCATTESTLKEGMVITVEPGIYFSRYALTNAKTQPVGKYIDFEVVERYIPVGGVRIEDDILVTARGNENLTTAPKGEEMMKIVRSTSV